MSSNLERFCHSIDVLTADDTICPEEFTRKTHDFALRMTINENNPNFFTIYSDEIVGEASNKLVCTLR